jgi:hypothetical protein
MRTILSLPSTKKALLLFAIVCAVCVSSLAGSQNKYMNVNLRSAYKQGLMLEYRSGNVPLIIVLNELEIIVNQEIKKSESLEFYISLNLHDKKIKGSLPNHNSNIPENLSQIKLTNREIKYTLFSWMKAHLEPNDIGWELAGNKLFFYLRESNEKKSDSSNDIFSKPPIGEGEKRQSF